MIVYLLKILPVFFQIGHLQVRDKWRSTADSWHYLVFRLTIRHVTNLLGTNLINGSMTLTMKWRKAGRLKLSRTSSGFLLLQRHLTVPFCFVI